MTETMYENWFLLFLFFIVMSALGAGAAYLADWLERKYPWRMK